MAVAIREAHSPDWIGTEVSFSRELSETEHFNATYSTGDAALSEGDEDYDEYPYRVTIFVTGHAADPNNADIKTSHCVEAVIRLVPEAVDDDPNGWDELKQYTFCQLNDYDSMVIMLPCRIEDRVRIRSKLYFCQDVYGAVDLGWDQVSDVRYWYCSDLNYMRDNGWPDYRPFNGPVHIDYNNQDSTTLGLLISGLSLPMTHITTGSSYTWSNPLAEESYKLYPGGKTYYAQIIGGDINNTDLEPDPKTNPLGIFISDNDIHLRGNVSLQGTLIVRDNEDVEFENDNNKLSSLTVPPYENRGMPTDFRLRLPTVIGSNDCRVSDGAKLEIKGMTLFRQRVEIESADQCDTSVTINGNVSANSLRIHARRDWLKTKDWWLEKYNLFFAMFYPQWYFPDLLDDACGLSPQPQIRIKPDTDQTRYHWYSGDYPLFRQAKDGSGNDKGLTWEIIRWTDNP